MKRDFTKTAFHSKLFKGRSNWYFCYLKTEKLAHVLAVLAARSVSDSAEALKGTANFAVQVMQDVIYASAGEIVEETLLADLFSIISTLRLHATRGYISRETSRVLVEEYEALVDRLVGDSRHLGLSVSPQDLAVPALEDEPLFTPLPSLLSLASTSAGLKDISKGHKTQKDSESSKGQNRALLILDYVRKSNGVSIKDIAKVVQGYSEKTIQRELNTLIEQGVIKREGERRWSVYRAI
jgi:hypothetical protein